MTATGAVALGKALKERERLKLTPGKHVIRVRLITGRGKRR